MNVIQFNSLFPKAMRLIGEYINIFTVHVTSGVIGRNKKNNALVNSSSFIRLNGYIMVMFISDLHQ